MYYSDQKITFEGIISDAEDTVDQLEAYWESDIDGVLGNIDTQADSTGTIIVMNICPKESMELHVEDTTGKLETVVIIAGPPPAPCVVLTPKMVPLVLKGML